MNGRKLLLTLRRYLTLPFAILLALIISTIFIYWAGYDPGSAAIAIYQSTLGSFANFADTLVKATPLIFTSVGICITFRTRIFNIGAEAMFLAGAITTGWLGVSLGFLPSFILLPILLLAGAFAGALIGILVGFIKVRFGSSEIITTMMMNYVLVLFLGYLTHGPLMEAKGLFPQSAEIAPAAMLPRIFPGTRLHAGFFISLIVAVLGYIFLYKSVLGYELRAVGLNDKTAEHNGINISKCILIAFAISGAFAGLGGFSEVGGVTLRLYDNISPGYGYDAIALALIANSNPVGAVFVSILFGILKAGSNMMQRTAGISSTFVYVFQGLVVLFVVLSSEASWIREELKRIWNTMTSRFKEV